MEAVQKQTYEERLGWQYSVSTIATTAVNPMASIRIEKRQQQQDIFMLDESSRPTCRWRLLGVENECNSSRNGSRGKRDKISVIPRMNGDRRSVLGIITTWAHHGKNENTKAQY